MDDGRLCRMGFCFGGTQTVNSGAFAVAGDFRSQYKNSVLPDFEYRKA